MSWLWKIGSGFGGGPEQRTASRTGLAQRVSGEDEARVGVAAGVFCLVLAMGEWEVGAWTGWVDGSADVLQMCWAGWAVRVYRAMVGRVGGGCFNVLDQPWRGSNAARHECLIFDQGREGLHR